MQNLRLGYFEIIGWKSLKAATLRSLKILIISNDVPGNFSEMWKAVPNLLKAECDVRASAPKLVILSAAPDGSIKRHSILRLRASQSTRVSALRMTDLGEFVTTKHVILALMGRSPGLETPLNAER